MARSYPRNVRNYRELRNYCKLYGRKKEKIDIIRKRFVLEFHWASYYVHVPPLILSSLPAPSNEICTSKVLYDSLSPGFAIILVALAKRDVHATYARRTRDVQSPTIQENLYGIQIIKSNLPP